MFSCCSPTSTSHLVERSSEQPRPRPSPIIVTGKCGSGEFGDVYEALSERRSPIALKIVPAANGIQSLCLKREATALQRCQELGIPGVVRFRSYRENQNPLASSSATRQCNVLEMDKVNGETLDARIKRGHIDEKACKQIAQQLLQTLSKLHRNAHMTHRDLKPANIMFHDDKVILIDFGLTSEREKPTTPAGTPYYMAPEIYMSPYSPYTCKVDLWSLGVILYYASTGTKPFTGKKMKDIFIGIQRHLTGCSLLTFPPSSNLSSECQNFILSLLTRADSRPSAETALEHPWFSC